MLSGLTAHGVPHADAARAAGLPAISILFAAFLGYNPIQHLVGTHVLNGLPASQHAALTGHSFFPQLISHSFRTGLHDAFLFAIIACLIAAVASWSRGGVKQSSDSTSGAGSTDPAAREAGRSGSRELVRG
jgi:ABC-type Fe3+ transport system permease subunit